MALLSKSELRPLIIRGIGVVVTALSSLVGLKVLLKMPEAEGVVLIAVLGWMAFMPLGQIGYGRPVYGLLRRDHTLGQTDPAMTRYFLLKFARLALLSTLAFCVLSGVYAACYGRWTTSLAVAIFALGLAALNSGIFQRDMAYALSLERHYETMELARRLGLLLAFLALARGLPIWGFGLVTLVAGFYSQRWLANMIGSGATELPTSIVANEVDNASFKGDARRYLLFTANEILLYNLPLVVFTLLGQAREIIFASIWLRLFQLLVLPMRLGVDARMNRLVSAYFRGDVQATRRGLLLNVGAAALITTLLLVVVTQFKLAIFGWLGARALGEDPYLMPSVAIWSLSNTIQHTYGSFTLSYGGGFGFASMTSLLTLLCIAGTFGVMQLLHLPAGQIFIGTGLMYGIFAIGYGLHVRGLLRYQVAPS